MINKKGEVAEGMTWFFSFVLIFIIVAGFLMLSVYYSAKKTVAPSDLLLNNDKNELSIGDSKEIKSNSYEINKKLISFLNSYSENQNIKFIDLVAFNYTNGAYLSDSLKVEIKSYFDNMENGNCYHLCSYSQDGVVSEVSTSSCKSNQFCYFTENKDFESASLIYSESSKFNITLYEEKK